MALNNINWNQIAQSINNAAWGQRQAVIMRHCERLGVDRSTLYRYLQRETGVRKKVDRAVVIDPDNRILYKIMDMKLSAEMLHLAGREPDTRWILRELVRMGEPGMEQFIVFDEQGDPLKDPDDGGIRVKVSTVNRRLNELGYREKQPFKRIESRYANQVHMIDFSRSKYFQLFDYDAERDDYMLVVSGKELHYKKDEHRLRTWIVQYMDDYSRLRKIRAYAETNESAFLGLDHLNYVYNGFEAHPLHYLPIQWLRCDNGSFRRAKETQTALEALDITMPPQMPEQKGGTAKVENRFRSLWGEFELRLASKLGGSGARLWLSEFNEELELFSLSELEKRHPFRRDMTKGEVYSQSLSDRSIQQRTTDVDVIRMACKVEYRRVDGSLRVGLNNTFYSVPQYVDGIPTIGKRIAIHINKYNELTGKLIDDLATSTFDLHEWEPAYWGEFEQFKQVHRTTREKAIKSGKVSSPWDGRDRNIHHHARPDTDEIEYMKPRTQQVVADSPFIRRASDTGRVFHKALDARQFIGSRVQVLGLVFADVKPYFEQQLSELPITEASLQRTIDQIFTDYDSGKLVANY